MPITRECKCGTSFEVAAPSSRKMNCSAKCRATGRAPRREDPRRKAVWIDRQCPCGKSFTVSASAVARGEGLACSQRCGALYRVRNGQRSDPEKRYVSPRDGYAWIYLPPEQRPSGWTVSRYPEHRQIMREILGRDLFPDENVHHINGIKDDNRPENLELWITHQPKGHRVEDALSWAREVVARYG